VHHKSNMNNELIFGLQFNHRFVSSCEHAQYSFLVIVGGEVHRCPALLIGQQHVGAVGEQARNGVERTASNGKMKRSWTWRQRRNQTVKTLPLVAYCMHTSTSPVDCPILRTIGIMWIILIFKNISGERNGPAHRTRHTATQYPGHDVKLHPHRVMSRARR